MEQIKKDQILNEMSATSPGCTSSSDLAYIMYTSGTTGNPKGVMVEQKNIVRLVRNTNYIQFHEHDRIIQASSVSFDASTFEVWGALLNGAALHIIDKDELLDASSFEKILKTSKITICWLTSPLFNSLADIDPLMFSGLRTLVVGGDVLSVHHINKVKKLNPGLQIINGYGPTENTTFSTCYEINEMHEHTIPIGRPIANSQCYILNEYTLELLPQGIPGELCVSGEGLARGYLNDPELNRQKFIDHPFIPGKKMYRTGDLAKWKKDGTIEFLGRIDNQVKIRGYRVEAEEVRLRMMDIEGVNEVVMLVRKNELQENQLFAYVVSKEITVDEIRKKLVRNLPDFMMPAFIMLMEHIPKNSNGKIDIKQLPLPSVENGARNEYEAPGNKTEKILSGIWANVLGIQREIGIHENFFSIGGHSLKATRIISLVYKELGIKINLKEVFTYPTISEFCLLLSSSEITGFQGIPSIPVSGNYELSHSQKRMWIYDQVSNDKSGYNIFGAFLLEGTFSEKSFEKAFELLINRHEILRTTFVGNNDRVQQKINKYEDTGFRVKFIETPSVDKEKSVAGIVAMEEKGLFDLKTGPLLRATIILLEPDKRLFLLTLHHIISDGWSMEILINELLGFYTACFKEQEIVLPELRIQYKEYAAWQNGLIMSSDIKTHRDYWKSTFKEIPPVLEIPADHQRPAVKTYSGNRVVFPYGPGFSKTLKQYASGKGVSMYVLLLTGLKTLLYRYTGLEDLVIGTPVACRNHIDLHDQVGFYVNTLPVRSRFSGTDPFDHLLSHVKNVVLESFSHEMYPFDKIVEDANLVYDMSRNPLFDVVLQVLNTENSIEYGKEYCGLKINEFNAAVSTTVFDLNFIFVEQNDELRLLLNYNTDIFHLPRIERLLRHYKTLLESIIKDDTVMIRHLEYLSGEEQKIQEENNALLKVYTQQNIREINF
ncbi:MAG: grsB [Bacteroidetes bacterium]|nr:grsB [Bacteroidota bacterium]